MPLAQGQILQNRYRIVRMLGQGGMAAVYLVQDLQRGNRWVAIKEMIPDPNAGAHALAQARTQFRREAQVLMSLRHHNLPQVYESFAQGGNEYLVMQYIEGRNLLDIAAADWQQGRTLGESRVLGWAMQIMDALEYLHGQRPYPVLHRDVKPQNIILTPGGELYLVDFGLVKLLDPNNPQTMTALRGLGTPEYAPPEQYASGGTHTGPHSDVYALGATLYHLLTRQPPSTATDRLLPAPMTRPLVSPRQLNPAISPPVEQALVKALELAPAGRFTSVAEMRRALLGQGVAGPMLSPTRRMVPVGWVMGVGAMAFLVIVVLILVAVLGGGLGPGLGTLAPTAIARATAMPVPLTAMPVPPTDTLTPTPVPPTATPIPPTDTPTSPPPSLTPTDTAMPTDTPTSPLPSPTSTDTPVPTDTPTSPPPPTLGPPRITAANADRVELLRTLEGHTSWVSSVAFSPDGQILASGSFDGKVKLWRVADWTLIDTLQHADRVGSVAFSPDGSLLASGFGKGGSESGNYGNINLWQTPSGTLLRTMKGHGYPPYGLAFSPDGTLLASASPDWTVRLWQVSDGTPLYTFNQEAAQRVVFSPDGTLLAATGTQTQLWRVADRTLLQTLKTPDMPFDIAFSPDGTLLATAWPMIEVWHVADGAHWYTLSGERPGSVAFSPDGGILVSGWGEGIQLWGADRRLLRTLRGHTRVVVSVAFSPDGTMLASGSWDGTVRLWGVK